MAFLLYSTTPMKSGNRRYKKIGEFSLAGNRTGLIFKACQQYLTRAPVGWTVTEKDLLRAGGHDESSHALVTDFSPARKGEVNLLQIKAISGFTYPEWTPVMVTMEVLQNDSVSDEAVDSFKQSFDDSQSSRDIVRTFLYLQGGFREGGWQFGPVGSVNGPLLWKDAMGYFLDQIGR